MTKTQLLLTGLITGAMAFGVGCRTDQTASRGPAPTSPMSNTGGSGDVTHRTRGEGMTPMPEENGTREMEPEVHENPTSPPPAPGIGGSGTDRLPPESNLEPGSSVPMPTPVH